VKGTIRLFAIICCLTTIAATAQAQASPSEAWVLWDKRTDDFGKSTTWTIVNGFDTVASCKVVAENLALDQARWARSARWIKVHYAYRFTVGIEITSITNSMTSTFREFDFLCLPGTIDPRPRTQGAQ
jgi:hypothetical protein